MQITLEIDEKIMSKIDAFSNDRTEYFQKAIEEKIKRDEIQRLSYEEKVKRTVESYKKFPQQPEECEIWFEEQVWED